MLIRRSMNSYILSPRSVTRTPIGMFSRSLKFEIAFFDLVDTAFWPVIVLISSSAASISFLSVTATPIPLLMQIFSIFGTCMIDVYSNFCLSAGTISFEYLSFNLGVAIRYKISGFLRISLQFTFLVHLAACAGKFTRAIDELQVTDVDRCLSLVDSAFRLAC